MKSILVLGYFGYVTNQLDGQTIKTRNIYELIRGRETEIDAKVSFFDTQSFKASRFNVLRMFLIIAKAKKIIYLGAHNNLKYLFPLIFLLCWVLRKDIHFVVVGGWLFEFLKYKPIHRVMLKHIVAVYPQTRYMCKQLQDEYGFKNVCQLNNFRILSSERATSVSGIARTDNVLKFVFMARVHPMKGVDVVGKIAEQLRLRNHRDVIIDIYGPVYEPYRLEFDSMVEEYSGVLNYKGVLQPSEIYQSLIDYDFMLFPTKYYTEGFPGSILDSYIAGVPVIASRWKYAEEFVEHGFSGLICDFDDDDAFVESALGLIDDKALVCKLKTGVQRYANKYSPAMAWDVLKPLILK